MSRARSSRRGPCARARRPLAVLLLAGVLLGLGGCASAVDSIERLGRKAAERVGTRDGTERAGTTRDAPEHLGTDRDSEAVRTATE
ncbi:hypothetical protein R6L23_08685 [Streptomyces sp. SR27]|uniref:hypothetical protein n=1 Tax=Streptomyces sp. SR27 TaxID=3076630 RepID=UPI00295BE24D|nr:hypothetical protein [Streptomyces sp. SR27]MDV9188292.1 hypothetical protein [Streptomyces sp. SR27]